jgi:hypothetical protein
MAANHVLTTAETKPTFQQLLNRVHVLHGQVADLEQYCAANFTHYYGIMTLHRLMLEDMEIHIKKCPKRGIES